MCKLAALIRFQPHPLPSNRSFERTPLAALAAAPHWSASMTGSFPKITPLPDTLLACHKRKLPAGVTLNFIR